MNFFNRTPASPQPQEMQLQQRAIHTLDDACGVELACAEGSLWVTLDGIEDDYVMEAGDTFSTRLHRRAVVYALEPSRLSVSAAPDIRLTLYRRKRTMDTFSRFHAMPFMKAAR